MPIPYGVISRAEGETRANQGIGHIIVGNVVSRLGTIIEIPDEGEPDEIPFSILGHRFGNPLRLLFQGIVQGEFEALPSAVQIFRGGPAKFGDTEIGIVSGRANTVDVTFQSAAEAPAGMRVIEGPLKFAVGSSGISR